ncbi:hypothetical protein LSAT2_004032 [Lamellibrachia satsuma]|nr:hypothetical protein LSAT2_004032 [Lamellibrachia satsuma]
MACTILTVLALMFVSTIHCFPNGAPVEKHPEICSGSMTPFHNFTAKTSRAPYELVVSGCYKAGRAAKVTVKATSGYYEGMFMLARLPGNNVTAYGTFKPGNSDQFKLVACYKQAGSAVTQSLKKKYTSEEFWWTAPIDFKKTIQFQATLVKETDEFWVNVFSSDVQFSETCPEEKTSGAARLHLPAGFLTAVAAVVAFLLRLQ